MTPLQRDGRCVRWATKATRGHDQPEQKGVDYMRVLAARFPDRERASAALGRLYRRLPLDPSDVDIAPLGLPGEQPDSATILAGRFPEALAPEVSRVVRESGGQIVADVDERQTRPRTSGSRRVDEPRELARHH